MTPGLRNPWAARELRRRAAARGTSPKALLRDEIFPKAIVLVSGNAATPQRIRVGRDWGTNRHGKVEIASPTEGLPVGASVRWWFSQVYAAATTILLDKDYPPRTAQSVELVLCEEAALERLVAPESPGARDSAMLTVLLHEEDVDPSEQLHRLLSVASPRARELLMLRQQGLSTKEAASMIGMSPSTAYVHYHRTREKAKSQ